MIQKLLICCLLITGSVAKAEVGSADSFSDRLSSLLKKTLGEKISRTSYDVTVALPSLEKVSAELSDFETLNSARLIEDKTTGVATFELSGTDNQQGAISRVIQTPYEAWVKVPVANHRIYPNSKLKNEDFDMDVCFVFFILFLLVIVLLVLILTLPYGVYYH